MTLGLKRCVLGIGLHPFDKIERGFAVGEPELKFSETDER